MTSSDLDAVPGLGPARRATLIKHFGSVRKLRAADVDEIAALPGFGRRTAEAVLAALQPSEPVDPPPDGGSDRSQPTGAGAGAS